MKKIHTTTTLQMTHELHTQLKMMCVLTKKSLGAFVRQAVIEKIANLKKQELKKD